MRTPAQRKRDRIARAFGPIERVRWVQSLPCLVCGDSPCENAHSVGGGMGRRADYQTIVPLCPTHHREQHQMGTKSFQARYGVSLTDRAAQIQQAWTRREEG